MSAVVDCFKPVYIQRIAQLTNKTNQFNLTALRCTKEDIKQMQEARNYICLCGHLSDKFCNYGLVSVVAGEMIGNKVYIRIWLMSRRVFKRKMEGTMLNVLVGQAAKQGVDEVIGYYYPTSKNGMVKDFYGTMGFEKISEDMEGNSIWRQRIAEFTEKKIQMEVKNAMSYV